MPELDSLDLQGVMIHVGVIACFAAALSRAPKPQLPPRDEEAAQ